MKVLTSVFVTLCIAVSSTAKHKAVPILSPNLYVAPNGNDNNPGTEAKPFATLERAKKAVRKFKRNVPSKVKYNPRRLRMGLTVMALMAEMRSRRSQQ